MTFKRGIPFWRAGFRRKLGACISGLLIFTGILLTVPADATAAGDALWEIVSTCLDPTVADYCQKCRWPRIESFCPHDGKCMNTTQVWAETPEFVAIRDLKMCDCPEEFIHGLAIPRTRVTGIEDPSRPDGIWRFAWKVAEQMIHDTDTIALVVNPERLRSQDQLHIHVLRLRKDACQQLAKLPASRIQDVDGVWEAARQGAAAVGLDDYGVIVIRHPDGGFMVRVEKESPEWLYTEWACR